MRIYRMVAFVFLTILFGFIATSPLYAQPEVVTPADEFGITEVGDSISIPATPNSDLRVLIVRILNLVLGFLGVVAFCIVLYAGYLWMMSRGNEEQVATAKKMLINGVIGLAIVMSAFAITSFILRALRGLGEGGPGNGDAPPQVQTYAFSGALGRIIKDHYPRRGQREVARNTSVVVTFGVPINPMSIIENSNRTCWDADFLGPTTECVDLSNNPVTADTPVEQIARPYLGDCRDLDFDGITELKTSECDQLKSTIVSIDEKSKFTSSTGGQLGIPAAALATYTSERNVFSFVFKPHDYLGSPVDDVEYRVRLSTSILRSDQNESIFGNGIPYLWDFTTGNFIDVDPPVVVDMYPSPNSTIPRNSIIQITFSEPIDPTVVESVVNDGTISTFTPINQILADTRKSPTGTWRLSNGYKTLEFISGEACGFNSCGEQMFCLPVACQGAECLNPYETLLRTAESTNNSEAPFEAVPFSGIYDLAFNGLDNIVDNTTNPRLTRPNPNSSPVIGAAEKAPDNFWWGFVVENTIDRSAPYIQEILPGPGAEDISGDAPVYLQFSKRMMSNSIVGNQSQPGISLEEYPAYVCADAAIDTVSPNSCDNDLRLPDIDFWLDSEFGENMTRTHVGHREFGPNNLDLYYLPSVPSTVKSVNQNCLYPGRGPSPNILATPETPSTCEITLDPEGNFVSGEGCANVTIDADSDTACVYDPASPDQSAANIAECLSTLYSQSPSSY